MINDNDDFDYVQMRQIQNKNIKKLRYQAAKEYSIDKKNDHAFVVPQINDKDTTYSGYIYLGSPVSMPAKVVFDTGSSFLAVTSNFC